MFDDAELLPSGAQKHVVRRRPDKASHRVWRAPGRTGKRIHATILVREDVPMPAAPQLPPGDALALESLITPTPQGIASRILGKTAGGNMTLFAFDEGQGLTEHSSPFDAFVLVLDGELTLTIGGKSVRAAPGTIVRMPADVPHAVDALEPCRMLLIMLK
jgi:quercetin dioxygenase-like cupin family protein